MSPKQSLEREVRLTASESVWLMASSLCIFQDTVKQTEQDVGGLPVVSGQASEKLENQKAHRKSMRVLPHKVLFKPVIGMRIVCIVVLVLGLPLQPAKHQTPT